MKLNLKIRLRNPVFIVQILMAVLIPILSYFGMTTKDLTSWGVLFQTFFHALENPYVLAMVAVSVWNAVTDPTTKGLGDSQKVLNYNQPVK